MILLSTPRIFTEISTKQPAIFWEIKGRRILKIRFPTNKLPLLYTKVLQDLLQMSIYYILLDTKRIQKQSYAFPKKKKN